MRRLNGVADHFASQLFVSVEVADALAEGRPVVALESTIITHGQPYPANVECARQVEQVVRQHGAVPATIAILGGRILVGLSQAQIEHLGKRGHEVVKCSRRDLAVVLARKQDGSTTVSATMIVAKMAGIAVFVTGGIGGVHRGEVFDVSADLTELGRTGGLAVVCSGAKSILDIAATLEVLETQGVTVVTLGQKEFPAFFTRKSKYNSHVQAKELGEVAQMLKTNVRLNLGSGMLVAVPVPAEMEASTSVELATEQAVREAKERGISGKDVTPFLLQRISDLSGAESLKSNIALIKNNARVGAELACLMRPVSLLVIGGAALDRSFQAASSFVAGESNIASLCSVSAGGVGRNVTECLARLSSSMRVAFASVVGEDDAGKQIVGELEGLGVDCRGVSVSKEHSTATYCSFLRSNGELAGAMAAMQIFDKATPVVSIATSRPSVVVMDCNFPSAFILEQLQRFAGAQCWIEPTSEAKCIRAADAIRRGLVYGIAPNETEWAALNKELGKSLLDFVHVAVVKRGPKGVDIHRRGHAGVLSFPAPIVERIVSVSGAGDALLASILVMLYDKRETNWDSIMAAANAVVAQVLQSDKSVAHTLSPQ